MKQDSTSSDSLLTKVERLLAGLGEPSELQQLLARIAGQAYTLTGADIVAVYAINPINASEPFKRKFFPPPTIIGELQRHESSQAQIPRPDGVSQEIVERGFIFVEDILLSSRYRSSFVKLEGVRSFAGVALRADPDGRLFGVMYVDYRVPHKFSEFEQQRLLTFAKFAGILLSSRWHLQRYKEVGRIGQEINQNLSTVESIFERLQRHLPGIVNADQSMLLAVYQSHKGTLDIHLSEKGKPTYTPDDPFEGGCKWVIEMGESLLIRDLAREEESLKQRGVHLVDMPVETLRARSLIFVPLLLRNVDMADAVPLGAFSIQHEDPNVFDEEDLRILQVLGPHLALAISNIRLFTGMERLAESGQALTLHLESEHLLEQIVYEIKQATGADIIVLYPYSQATGTYDLPPRQSGDFLAPDFSPRDFVRPDDMASLTIHKKEPEFARNSSNLYMKLGGDAARRLGNFETREQIASTAALPLRVGDEPVGALFVNYRVRQRFDAPQKELIRSLASYAAIAIRNARLLGSAQHRHVRELELLRDIDSRIGSILDLQKLLQGILELVGEHIEVDEASVLLYEPETRMLDTVAAIGRNAEKSRTQKVALDDGRGIVREVFRWRRPICVNNVRTDLKWRDRHLEVASDTLSELDVPIFHSDEVIGVINMENTREAAFSQADQEFLVTLAGQAALAIRNARAYEREKRIASERQALVDIGKEIVSKLDSQLVFDTILQKALQVTNSQAGNLMLFDPLRNDLWMAAERGVVGYKIGYRLSLEEGIVGEVAKRGKLLNVDVCSPPWNDVFLGFIPGSCSELAVPLLEGERLRGVLNIESTQRNYFKEHDERLLTTLADMAVIALHNVEQFNSVIEGKARLEALNRVDVEIIALAENPDAVMRAIVENSLALTAADSADLSLYVEDEIRTSYLASRNDTQEVVIAVAKGEKVAAIPRGIIAHVAATKKGYWTQGDAQSDPYYIGAPDISSELAVPLLSKSQRLVGVLNLESKESFAFDAEDAAILKLLAGQAVIAYNLAQSYAAAQSERRRFEDLHRVGEEIAELVDTANIPKAYEIVAHKLAARSPTGQVVIRRYQEDTQELVIVYCVQRRDKPPYKYMKLNEGVNGQVARERKTVAISDTKKELQGVHPKPSDSKTRSLIVAPVDFGEEFYGTLTLSESSPDAFGEADVKLVDGLARQLALTLHRLEITEANSQAEQRANAAEAMSAMGQSAFELAHRLGNDLGLVRTYVENIEDILKGVNIGDLPTELAKIRRDVKKVMDLSHGLKAIFDDYRDGKRPKLLSVSIPPEVLIEETILSLPELPGNIQVSSFVEPVTPRVRADHGQVADILRNLYTNAVQAMPHGGEVVLSARHAGRYVEFQVQDTGPGISEDLQKRIFDLFYSTKGSTGFGLWSARRNALANNGDLTVVSESGRGATFVLLLPRADAPAGGSER